MKTTYEYSDIDAQGNWTIRISIGKYFEKGKEKIIGGDVTTRSIDYH